MLWDFIGDNGQANHEHFLGLFGFRPQLQTLTRTGWT